MTRNTSQPGLPWLAATPIALLTAVPLAVLLAFLWQPESAVWQHLWQYQLPRLLYNTGWLVTGVGLGVTVLGVSLAWLVAACEFPGRRLFSWSLLLPLALPGYVTAFVWLGLFDITGSVSLWLRNHAGFILPSLRQPAGLVMVMTLSLFPYVYLNARAAFASQGQRLLEAAASMGLSRQQAFWRVILPMARPGIATGLLLAVMETLADFGAVAVFNIDTFTTAIYKAWFQLFSLPAAAQLASLLIIAVLSLSLLEQWIRHHRQYNLGGRGQQPVRRVQLRGWRAAAASGWAGLVLLLAFVVPFGQLLVWAMGVFMRDFDSRQWLFAWHSLLLAGMGAVLLTALAVALGYAHRLHNTAAMQITVRIAALGYAIPGAVLAVGIVIPVAWLDGRIAAWSGAEGPWLQGSLAVMLLACSARFMAVGLGPVEAGLGRIATHLDEAARLLGSSALDRLRRLHLPLLRAPLLVALALCFVDLVKELPITLMTRPFGWDTLAVRVFEMTSEGEWQRAALPALLIALTGLVPVILLARDTTGHANRNGETHA